MKELTYYISTLLLILILISSGTALSQSLKGIIHDLETEEPIIAAVVQIEDNGHYATTNDAGEFFFTNIRQGQYSLLINHIGYRNTHIDIKIDSDTTKFIVIHLVPKSLEISQVLITGEHTHSKFDEVMLSSSKLKGRRLEKNLSFTLASTLKNEAGLAMRSMGPAPARPVIRGLSGDRIFIAEDGKKSVDLSATSPDHAVTIDPFGLESIEVIRGPKVLLNTPTTLGGVVNAIRHEIPVEKHDEIYTTLGGYGETVNKGYLGSAIVEVPFSAFMVRGEISRRKTDDMKTPIGYLNNSYSENLNYSGGLSYFPEFGYIGGSYKSFELKYGVPGGFVGAHPNGVDIDMWKTQYNLKSKININTHSFEDININFSRAFYRHKEFESSGALGAEFRIIEYFGHVDVDHNQLWAFDKGTIKLSADIRDFNIGGFVFTSPSKSYNISLAAFETISMDRLNFEFGARFNFDNIVPEKEENAKIGYVRSRKFNTYSLSFSTLYSLTNIVYIGGNISKSSRVPTIEELFSQGPHLAAYSYEIGNPDLEAESGIGTELFVYHKFDGFDFNINAFYNFLDNYIIARNTGDTNYQTLLPIYKSEGVPADLYGIEGRLNWKLSRIVSINSTAGYTVGSFRDSGNPLPQIPPFKGTLGIQYTRNNFNFTFTSEFAAAQKNVDQFEDPTSGYIIFNTGVQYSIYSKSLIHNFSLAYENIFNTEYRNHLSRVKSIMPEAGTNVRLTYKLFIHY